MEREDLLPPSQPPSTCPYPEPDQSSPCPPSHFLNIYFNIILSSRAGSSKWSTSLRVTTACLCKKLSSPPQVLHAPPISFFSIFITRTIFGKQYRSLCSSLCSFLHSLVTSSLSGPNSPLSILFSNSLSLRSSLNVRDQVSHFLVSYEVKNIISTRFLLATVTMVRQCEMCVSKKRQVREHTLLSARCVCIYRRSPQRSQTASKLCSVVDTHWFFYCGLLFSILTCTVC